MISKKIECNHLHDGLVCLIKVARFYKNDYQISTKPKGFLITDHYYNYVLDVSRKTFILKNGKTTLIIDFNELKEFITILAPLIDPNKVNTWRKEIGLEPLDKYLLEIQGVNWTLANYFNDLPEGEKILKKKKEILNNTKERP